MQITLPKESLAQFCQRHHIRKLSVFGSVLRDDFQPDSDVDFLVEFQPEYTPGLIRIDQENFWIALLPSRLIHLILNR
jgi:predicted nucleotidyltransferase